MGLLSWLRAGTKSASIPLGGDTPYASTSFGMGQWPWLMPSTRIDYSVEAGQPLDNSIVMACCLWIMRTFPEAPLRVVSAGPDGKRDPIDAHPLTTLLKNPNPYYNGILLWQATALSWNLDGNAYWIKAPSEDGSQTLELWWEPHMTIRPVWDRKQPEKYITGYQLMRGGHWLEDPSQLLPPEQVVHFRFGMDLANPRVGISPLKSAMREIFTDNEAANFSASVLRNMGVPGLVVSPAVADYTIEDPEGLKNALAAKFSGDRRGEPMVMGGPTKAEILSWSPDQMNLDAMRSIPEERVTALLGLPAIVAGLGAGLDHATYSNFREAKASAYENNLIPTQDAFADEIQNALLTEFGDPEAELVEFDRSRVLALAEDQDALFTRVNAVWTGGLIKRSEGRNLLGQNLDTTPDDDIYYTDLVKKNAQMLENENPGTLLPPGVAELPAPTPQPVPTSPEAKAAPVTTEQRTGMDALTQAFGDLLDTLDAEAAGGDAESHRSTT